MAIRRVRALAAPLSALVLIGGLAALFPAGALAATSPVYVTAGGTDSGDCASAATACASLTYALKQVSSGGTVYVSRTIDIWNATNNPGDDTGVTVAQNVTIAQAPGAASAVIEGTGRPVAGSLLTIGGTAQVTLSGLTLKDGDSNVGYTGGAITNNAGGTLTINNCNFADNRADASSHGDGGAIDNADDGGTGTVTITGSTFTGNTSPSTSSGNGGAIDNADYGGTGTLSIDSSTFTANATGNGDGAAIDSGGDMGSSSNASVGTLSVTDSAFVDNTAVDAGGAIGIGGYRGSGTATITGTTFSGNTAASDGGAIDIGGHSGSGTATITGTTFSGNTAASDGGAIDIADYSGAGTVTVTGSTFDSNVVTGYDGGAIDLADDAGHAMLTVDRSTFSANTAVTDGGAIDVSDYSGNATLAVDRSTFAGNTAYAGGAIDNADPSYNGGSAGSGVTTVEASTFAGNSATQLGNVIDNGAQPANSSNPTTATFNAVADVFTGSCANGTSANGATWNDDGYNAATDSSCLGSPAASTDAAVSAAIGQDLGSLAITAGTTQTLQMLAANPARGLIPVGATATVGSTSVALCPVTDQRGTASESGKPCNPGSVQIGAPQITASLSSTGTESSAGVWNAPVTVTFTCTANGAALTCPSPQTISTNGANQSVTQTVTAVDGGTASVTVSGINIEIATPATTTPTPITTTVPSAPHVTVKGKRFNGKSVLVRLACAASGSKCAGKITLRYTETVVRRHKKHRVTVVIASKHYSLGAGHTATVKFGLNATGRRLLKADHKLGAKGTVTVTETDGQSRTAAHFGLTLKQPKKK